MKKSSEREKIIKILFAQNPNAKTFHMTSDNQAFFQKGDAVNHGKTLEDKDVVEVKRPSDIVEDPDGENESNADTAKAERETLLARYSELYGEPAAKNITTDKLKAKIAEKESETV
ncbi:MAG: hypothetical protein ACO1NU_08715 [Arcticibacter sp.]